MNHWFRLYNTLVDDPKVQQLPDSLFKALINLWCVASQNDGVLPSNGDIAYKLRIKTEKAAEYVTKLVRAGLIDNVDGTFVPHNWDGRQFQSDSSTERVKRHRNKKRNVSGNVSSNGTETPVETDRAEKIKSELEKIEVAEDAREPLVSDAARDLADELLVIAGHELRFVPPGWCGAAMRVHTWLAQGWPREIILVGARKATAKSRGRPINSVQFYENAIAEEVARQAEPLPRVEVRQPEHLTVIANGKSQGGNIIQAADRLLDKIRSFDAGPSDDNNLRDGASEASARLLSQG
ncbi:hypothetical protein QIH87_50205 (plasmid) [Bradyrhizobium elkanii]|uniref:hypothetical protein n=1 Tax=Bradyrhizobium elkanii TaxID=29448 RepID=UPI0027150DE0|nr:hypothetical protein [Bradyrhizobium elkanii]WLB14805.1 hypothetical protein QIH87_50205 [Bradyrhizobium elkanii]WLB69104.1 hypothetical protein QIH89_27710 [Bradyrhizobium elkanii]